MLTFGHHLLTPEYGTFGRQSEWVHHRTVYHSREQGYQKHGTMRKEKKHLRRMDCCIRLFCHRLTRKQRKIVTTTAFLLFLTACLHAILASLSGLGEPRGKMKIEYVRPLDLRPEKSTINLNTPSDENRYPED